MDQRVERLAWDSPDPPDERSVSRRLRDERLDPIAWANGPFDRYAMHRHGYEKLLFCAAGSITFQVGEPPQEIELRPGDGLRIPAGTPHAATVGPSGCTCVEGHRG